MSRQSDIDSVGHLLRETFPPVGGGTQVERLARIEGKIETLLAVVEKLETRLATEERTNAALRNKGAGILIGITLVAGLIGAKLGALLTLLSGVAK